MPIIVLSRSQEDIISKYVKLVKKMICMEETDEKMQNSMTDLKVRSMRDNSIFTGIPEQKGEDTEELLQDFIQRKYKLDYTISFERVHRIGKWREFNEHPRNIVAKFTYFKDREFIRTKAAQKLSRSYVWVNEQFPQKSKREGKNSTRLCARLRRTKNAQNWSGIFYTSRERCIRHLLNPPRLKVTTAKTKDPLSRVGKLLGEVTADHIKDNDRDQPQNIDRDQPQNIRDRDTRENGQIQQILKNAI